ncbi:nitrate reductase protein [Rutstroemia sp. NJR-2017a WRK4]|nr:nitrate reductase protein [Rutstroemia sp. NJR-2017a WRK4]
MSLFAHIENPGTELPDTDCRLPPTPPETRDNSGDEVESVSSRDSLSSSTQQRYALPPPTRPPTKVLKEDLKTPDSHVPRDPRLIRLTGTHPFNVEAPLSALYDEGFLTSPELFYVRNHGAVPQVDDSSIPDWEFSIEGLVKNPRAAPLRGAKYVCMEGADKLPNGYYGTSLKLNWVMDPNRGIMVAHKMNGEMLRPDHGKPLRAVVPGQIGGRSVKWLKKIIVTAAPSDNWYHIYDNRVLPTMISPEQSANEPKWWIDERYAIYDLSTNSATAYPAHEERISLTNAPQTYRAKGYAYGGGGRRITRVEVTLDKGKSWALADIRYHEDDYRNNVETLFGGKLDMGWRETCFTWCFWEIDLQIEDLAIAGDIMVRAMDESMNVQPRDMYWSVLGMMNNPWYRITITKEGDSLRFEHPTQPALMPGGWMERVKAQGGNLANGFWGEKVGGEEESSTPVEEKKEIKMTKDGITREISIEELRAHDNDQEPWFVLNGEVYDGTPFLDAHPGGATSITGAAAQDATDEFMAIHSETAKAMMPTYHIGTLSRSAREALTSSEAASPESQTPRPIFLQPKTWQKAILASKKTISSDSRIFSFTLDHPEQEIGLPIGQHLMLRLRDPVTREAIIRSYTPYSLGSDKGRLDILIKLYLQDSTNPGGKMTSALDALPLGHAVDFKGPIGKFTYKGNGECEIGGKGRKVKRWVMICGGSGVTPIWAVLRAVMGEEEGQGGKCVLLDGNRREEDILLKEEIDALVRGREERCRVVYALSRPTEKWEGVRGRLDGEVLEREVGRFEVGEYREGEQLVLVCGPETLEKSVRGILGGLGWRDEDLLFF